MDNQSPISVPRLDAADSSTSFIPNRAYAKIWRAVGIFALVIGGLLGLAPLNALLSEVWARAHWSRASGQLAAFVQKWADENRSPGGNPSISTIRTVYWVEYEVDFRPSNGCRTGASFSPDASVPFPCTAWLHTIPSRSPAPAREWASRHRPGSAAQVLYEQNGPGVKLAGESLFDVVPWNKALASMVILAFGVVAFAAAQRRLRELAYLPKGEDLPAPASPSDSKPDDLIDTKLS
jgi:hypothetical protein